MSAPGFLAIGGVELANNARTMAYMQRGLAGPMFETVTGAPCPDLLTEAWPLATCASLASAYDNAIFVDPTPTWRKALTGGSAASETLWRESGTLGIPGSGGTGQGVALPDLGVVPETVRLAINVKQQPTNLRSWVVGRGVNVGTANYAFVGVQLGFSGGVWQFFSASRPPLGSQNGANISGTLPYSGPVNFWWETVFTATGFKTTLYGADPDMPGAPVLLTGSYGYDYSLVSVWATTVGQTEAASMATATETTIGGAQTMFPEAEVVLTELTVLPGAACVATGDLYPSDTLWPADDLCPALYGEFHDPGTDNAPWVDADRPESYGFLGLLIDVIDGLDVTSNRTMDAAATGIGGILGPETLDPRDVTVKGWLIADGAASMEYARRWLGDAMSGRLCSGCDSNYIDVRTTCGGRAAGGTFDTNRWRIYDVGLTSFTTDVGQQAALCDWVTDVSFKLAAADPYLYGPTVPAIAATAINPAGPDAPLVPFESWLFGAPAAICTTVVDQGIGYDAGIFTFYGGTAGIEAGEVYQSIGAYPADSLWPADCLYPADGSMQWSNDLCPFAFTFNIGAGETFVVDNSRRKLTWGLTDGTLLDGAPRLNLGPGDVIQWIDTCGGASIDACAVAYAACTCDDTATVSVATQHRER